MNRWKMHRLGFSIFGCTIARSSGFGMGTFLLRGNNASGKSITTQSFIPFLLDGNKSRSA